MITFDHVSLQYDAKHTALKDMSIHIDKGEFVFAGKSTFVKVLTHELIPESGTVVVNGINITKLKRSRVPYYRRSLGIVFQDFRLLSEKTVFDNIAFVLRVTGVKSREIKEKVNRVLDLVGLRNKAKELPSKLSGGEQQRTALARAIANNPPILICDEPTGNLDPETAYGIMKLLDDINKRGTTIVMATHARDIVDAMQKRVVTLHKGHIIRDIEKGGYSDEA